MQLLASLVQYILLACSQCVYLTLPDFPASYGIFFVTGQMDYSYNFSREALYKELG